MVAFVVVEDPTTDRTKEKHHEADNKIKKDRQKLDKTVNLGRNAKIIEIM